MLERQLVVALDVWKTVPAHHCVKSFRIRSYSGPYFPAFGLNTERYFVSLRIHSEWAKIRTRITPNTDTFYAMHVNPINPPFSYFEFAHNFESSGYDQNLRP